MCPPVATAVSSLLLLFLVLLLLLPQGSNAFVFHLLGLSIPLPLPDLIMPSSPIEAKLLYQRVIDPMYVLVGNEWAGGWVEGRNVVVVVTHVELERDKRERGK